MDLVGHTETYLLGPGFEVRETEWDLEIHVVVTDLSCGGVSF